MITQFSTFHYCEICTTFFKIASKFYSNNATYYILHFKAEIIVSPCCKRKQSGLSSFVNWKYLDLWLHLLCDFGVHNVNVILDVVTLSVSSLAYFHVGARRVLTISWCGGKDCSIVYPYLKGCYDIFTTLWLKYRAYKSCFLLVL